MKAVTVLALFLVGALVGGATVELVHRSADQRSRLTFARKLRCQSLAAAYVKSDSRQDFVNAVNFSPARNSCVASLIESSPSDVLIPGIKMPPGPKFTIYEVRDLISQQSLWSSICTEEDCRDDVKEPKMHKALDDAFAKAMAGRE